MTGAADRLRPVLPAIVQRLQYFARVPRENVNDLIDHLTATLAAHPSRTAAAAAARNARSERIAAGIRKAVGAAPLNVRALAGLIERRITKRGPAFYGLQTTPCVKTIRKVIREMATERSEKSGHSVDEMTPRDGTGALDCDQDTGINVTLRKSSDGNISIQERCAIEPAGGQA